MINFTDFCIIILLIISMIISYLILQSFQYKKSFFQINQILSSSETIEGSKIKILRNLHDYLEDKTDKQIMLDNFQFKCKYIRYFYYFLLIVIPLTTYTFLNQGLSESIKPYIIFFTPSVIILIFLSIYFLLLEFIHISMEIKRRKLFDRHYILEDFIFYFADLLFQCREFHPSKILKKLGKVIEVYISIFVKSYLLIFATTTIFLLLLNFYLLVINGDISKDATIEIFNKLILYVSSYKITESDSIQFSISTLFFTLAISGTVIFSINQSFLNQKRELENKLSNKFQDYVNWYSKNKLVLDLSIIDSFSENKRYKFNDALIELRSKINDPATKRLKMPVKRYESFIYLIFASYFGGIFTILFPITFMNFIFACFCIASIIFIVLAYQIFCDYKS